MRLFCWWKRSLMLTLSAREFRYQIFTNKSGLKVAALTLLLLLAFIAVPFYLLFYGALPVYAVGDPAQISDIVKILENIISLLAPAAGIAFFIMFLIGGFQFLTSGGDPQAAGAARATLTYAVIGIVLVIVSWLILVLIRDITGASVTTVELPGVL